MRDGKHDDVSLPLGVNCYCRLNQLAADATLRAFRQNGIGTGRTHPGWGHPIDSSPGNTMKALRGKISE